MVGRLVTYFYNKIYGFVSSEDGTNYFISSRTMEDKREQRRVVVGAVIEYTLEEADQGPIATHARVLNRFPSGYVFTTLSDGKEIRYKNLENLKLCNLMDEKSDNEEFIQACKESGFPKSAFDYVRIVTRDGHSTRVVGKDAPETMKRMAEEVYEGSIKDLYEKLYAELSEIHA